MIDKKNITGIILAGGKSSRMGSDKGLIYLKGQSFMTHILKAIKPFVNDIIIVSGNSDYDIYQQKRVEDLIKNSGPLGGLYTGLFYSETDINLVLSCDIPIINAQVLNILFDGFDVNYDVIQLCSQDSSMPLIALYKKQCMQLCLEHLNTDERRLKIVVKQFKTKTITVDNELKKYIRNINTENQLKALKNEIEH